MPTRAPAQPVVPEPSDAALAQAAEWYARLRDGKASGRERAAWQAWLQAADAHQAAWGHVEDIRRGFEPLRELPDPRRTADALGSAVRRLRARRRTLAGLAVLAGAGLLGWAGWREALLPAGLRAFWGDHRTATGEQRELTLGDGTRLWLNTASAINLRFDARARRVELVTGEMFIDTASDAGRPFLAETIHGRMRALGTRFNVRLEGTQTRLAVYDGAVEVRTAATGATRIVAAGRQIRFDAGRISDAEPADVAREAWTQGALVADNLPLREVVRELRRYRRGYVEVADAVAGLEVYGSFPIRDTDQVLRMLATALPIRIEQPFPGWTSVVARR